MRQHALPSVVLRDTADFLAYLDTLSNRKRKRVLRAQACMYARHGSVYDAVNGTSFTVQDAKRYDNTSMRVCQATGGKVQPMHATRPFNALVRPCHDIPEHKRAMWQAKPLMPDASNDILGRWQGVNGQSDRIQTSTLKGKAYWIATHPNG